MKLITCHHEWVLHCQAKYRVEPPQGYWWENAHHPLSERQGEANTERLWYPDHVVHGALQTLNTNYPCMHGCRVHQEREILAELYPEYSEIYEEAYVFCQRFFGERSLQLKVGCHGRSEEEMRISGELLGKANAEIGRGWMDPEYRNSEKYLQDRSKAGTRTKKEGKGIFNPDYVGSEKYYEDRRRGMKNQKRLKIGIFHPDYKPPTMSPEHRERMRAKGKEIWESTVDGFRSNAGNVAKHNKQNGWDPDARIRISE